MSVKTKVGGFATLLVAAVVVGGVYLVKSPTRQQTGQDDREVVVTGLWAPNPRIPDGVHVEVLNAGRPEVDGVVPHAPFAKLFQAKAGSQVEIRLRLLGDGITDTMGCSIMVNGIEVEKRIAKKVGKGFQLICWIIV